jgi:hypothetical protein
MSDTPINELGLNHEMSIDYFHHQMHVETKRLAEQVCASCDLDPHSRLAEKINDLEAGELVSLFYLMAHELLPLEEALGRVCKLARVEQPVILSTSLVCKPRDVMS